MITSTKNSLGYYVIPYLLQDCGYIGTIEVAVTGGTAPPDQKGGQQCSRSTAWYRIDGGKWVTSPFRSFHQTIKNIAEFVENLKE